MLNIFNRDKTLRKLKKLRISPSQYKSKDLNLMDEASPDSPKGFISRYEGYFEDSNFLFDAVSLLYLERKYEKSAQFIRITDDEKEISYVVNKIVNELGGDKDKKWSFNDNDLRKVRKTLKGEIEDSELRCWHLPLNGDAKWSIDIVVMLDTRLEEKSSGIVVSVCRY